MTRSRRAAGWAACCGAALLAAACTDGGPSQETTRYALTAAPLPAGGQRTPGCVPAEAPVAGYAFVGQTLVGDRSWEIELASTSMQRNESILVTLPDGYDASGDTRYPVLLLFHGSMGDHRDYLSHQLENLTEDLALIVVTPNGGPEGSYADWYGRSPAQTAPAPAWESFHLQEVVPFIRERFAVRLDRAGWATAGLSAGGNAAIKYLAANPQLARAAGSFSGALDTTLEYPYYPTLQTVLGAPSLVPTQGPTDLCRWGDPFLQKAWWFGDVPAHHAENLSAHALWIMSGDGRPGPHDLAAQFDPVETHTYWMTQSFLDALAWEGLTPAHTQFGPGTHAWPYWEEALADYLDWLMPQFEQPAPQPARFDYRSTRANFTAWDWSFAVTRPIKAFVYLESVSTAGFDAIGHGELQVLTAPVAAPNTAVRVAVDDTDSVHYTDQDGRLRLDVTLGPAPDDHQQDFPSDPPAQWPRIAVRFTAQH